MTKSRIQRVDLLYVWRRLSEMQILGVGDNIGVISYTELLYDARCLFHFVEGQVRVIWVGHLQRGLLTYFC